MDRPFVPNSQLSGKGDKFRGKLIIASNREPYTHRKTGRKLKLEIPAGGLVSALDMVLRVTGGTWVAWGSGSGDREGADDQGRCWVPPDNPAYKLRRVWLSPKAEGNYYSGFCNQVLWPLFHGETDRIIYKKPYWDEYVLTNRIFAETILEEADEDSTIWIHDYHPCLVPNFLRQTNPEGTIAHFWHVPWPGFTQFTNTPHCTDILAGLLGNDLIGFQIPLYAENFLECAAACLGATVDYDAMTVTRQGHVTQVRSFPISTDFKLFDTLAASSFTTAQTGWIRKKYHLPRLVGLSIDRLDYTKGISQRLRALDLFFRQSEDFREVFTFIQVAVMTRRENSYRQYRKEIEGIIAEVNSEFGTADWQPILYHQEKLEHQDLVAYYRLADVAVITPLRDGMNLVAKEYIAARNDGEGVLILGRGAGAAAELSEAIIIDPSDTEAFAHAIHRALTLSPQGKKRRMSRLRKRVQTHTVYSWIVDILDELTLIPAIKIGKRHALRYKKEIANLLVGRKPVLFLDFDGTLAPIVEHPEQAAMPIEFQPVLEKLKERCTVAIISGRSLDDIRNRVGLPGIIYGGNSGAELEGDSDCIGGRGYLEAFLLEARLAFAEIPGVLIEDKGMPLSIHFRWIEPVLLKEFLSFFNALYRKHAARISISEGKKVFEIRLKGTDGKGDAVKRIMKELGEDKIPVCLGDDTSDEDAFRAVRETGIAVSVGGSPEADYYLRNQGEVLEFLEMINSLL